MSAQRTPPKANSFVSIRDIWNQRDANRETSEPHAFPFSPQKSRSAFALPHSQKKKKKKPIGAPGVFSAPTKVSEKSPISRAKSFGEVCSVRSPKLAPTQRFKHSLSLPVTCSKSVSFKETNQIREIEMINELSESAILSMWWSEGDYIEMRKDWETVLYFLESGKSVCEDTLSVRGLQKRTDAGAWQLYERQRDARNAVFEVQDRQIKAKQNDPEEIASAYKKFTQTSIQEAIEQGVLDTKDADKIKKKKGKGKRSSTQTPKRSPKPKVKGPKVKKEVPPNLLQDSFFVHETSLSPRAAHSGSPKASTLLGIPKISPSNSPKAELPGDWFESDAPSKKVQFNAEVQYIKAKKVKDIEKSTKRRWLCPKELKSIERGYKAIVKMMEKSVDVEETDEQTVRGLENSTKDAEKRLARRRQAVMDMVLLEQANQRAKNMLNAEVLANACKKETEDACKSAIKQAKRDAKDAKKVRIRRQSMHGNLYKTISAGQKTSALSQANSCSADESSVEPEFVRLAKKRNARRSSCTDTANVTFNQLSPRDIAAAFADEETSKGGQSDSEHGEPAGSGPGTATTPSLAPNPKCKTLEPVSKQDEARSSVVSEVGCPSGKAPETHVGLLKESHTDTAKVYDSAGENRACTDGEPHCPPNVLPSARNDNLVQYHGEQSQKPKVCSSSIDNEGTLITRPKADDNDTESMSKRKNVSLIASIFQRKASSDPGVSSSNALTPRPISAASTGTNTVGSSKGGDAVPSAPYQESLCGPSVSCTQWTSSVDSCAKSSEERLPGEVKSVSLLPASELAESVTPTASSSCIRIAPADGNDLPVHRTTVDEEKADQCLGNSSRKESEQTQEKSVVEPERVALPRLKPSADLSSQNLPKAEGTKLSGFRTSVSSLASKFTFSGTPVSSPVVSSSTLAPSCPATRCNEKKSLDDGQKVTQQAEGRDDVPLCNIADVPKFSPTRVHSASTYLPSHNNRQQRIGGCYPDLTGAGVARATSFDGSVFPPLGNGDSSKAWAKEWNKRGGKRASKQLPLERPSKDDVDSSAVDHQWKLSNRATSKNETPVSENTESEPKTPAPTPQTVRAPDQSQLVRRVVEPIFNREPPTTETALSLSVESDPLSVKKECRGEANQAVSTGYVGVENKYDPLSIKEESRVAENISQEQAEQKIDSYEGSQLEPVSHGLKDEKCSDSTPTTGTHVEACTQKCLDATPQPGCVAKVQGSEPVACPIESVFPPISESGTVPQPVPDQPPSKQDPGLQRPVCNLDPPCPEKDHQENSKGKEEKEKVTEQHNEDWQNNHVDKEGEERNECEATGNEDVTAESSSFASVAVKFVPDILREPFCNAGKHPSCGPNVPERSVNTSPTSFCSRQNLFVTEEPVSDPASLTIGASDGPNEMAGGQSAITSSLEGPAQGVPEHNSTIDFTLTSATAKTDQKTAVVFSCGGPGSAATVQKTPIIHQTTIVAAPSGPALPETEQSPTLQAHVSSADDPLMTQEASHSQATVCTTSMMAEIAPPRKATVSSPEDSTMVVTEQAPPLNAIVSRLEGAPSAMTEQAKSPTQAIVLSPETQSFAVSEEAPPHAITPNLLEDPSSDMAKETPSPNVIASVAAAAELTTVSGTASTVEDPAASVLAIEEPALEEAVASSNSLAATSTAAAGEQPSDATIWLQVRTSDLIPIHTLDGRIMYLVTAVQQKQPGEHH